MNKPSKVIWHHSNGVLFFPCASTQHHTVDIVNQAHKKRWPGFTSQVYKNVKEEPYHVGYHLVIDLINEIITQTKAFHEEGAHCIGMNKSSIGVLIIGNYDTCSKDFIPKDKKWLIVKAWKICEEYAPYLLLKDNVPHRKYATKSCYGNSLTDDYIRNVILRDMTIDEASRDGAREQHITTLTNTLIELIEQYIILLTQRLSKKRLSLREK